ncbi:MAG: RIP metalloprotease RseP [Flavobacteriales bacterium]|nr:MAG: RIP metalloprotease RseP [Flavobacteriales bacterium]
MEFFIKAAQLILSLSILVILHEMGHFIPAKLFKTRVEKFYLFFNPWFSLFKFKRGETEYGIGWLPLGGYVKIAGMIDESMDKEQLKKEPEPWEFRAKPTWQRLIVMVGGVTVNLILGLAIYAMVLFTWGKTYLPVSNAKYGVVCDSLMLAQGFQDGDMILKVGSVVPETFNQISREILIEEAREVTISRNGEEQIVSLPEDIDQQLLENNKRALFAPQVPFVIDSILPNKNAAQSDLQTGDRVVGINDVETPYFHHFRNEIQKYRGERIALLVERENERKIIETEVDNEGMIGVANRPPTAYFEFERQTYGFFEAIPAGIEHGLNVLSGYVGSLKLIFTPAGAKQLGGFGAIGNLFAPQWNWQNFWEMTALISIILAFMNILPIPALDGGHVVFLLYEMFTRRKPNEKVLEYAQIAGMVILLTLVVYANGNDIVRWLGG